MKLWEKRHTLEVRVSLKALLYTMARNKALNAMRNAGRQVKLEQGAAGEYSDNTPGIEQHYAATQLDGYFQRWVKELPPRRAEAFVLSRYHGLSHQEISIIMGLSKRTVDTHIVHALRFLRGRFETLHNKGVRS